MRAPHFWNGPPDRRDWRALALAPLGHLYALATAHRLARGGQQHPSIPVICVGNLDVGGTGKTPSVIALATRLAEKGTLPHLVSRGYGGQVTGPLQVDPSVVICDQS